MGVTVGLGILTAMIFALGLTTNCANTTWVPLATSYYPTEMRAIQQRCCPTSLGWPPHP
jgi:hypothetical protein